MPYQIQVVESGVPNEPINTPADELGDALADVLDQLGINQNTEGHYQIVANYIEEPEDASYQEPVSEEEAEAKPQDRKKQSVLEREAREREQEEGTD